MGIRERAQAATQAKVTRKVSESEQSIQSLKDHYFQAFERALASLAERLGEEKFPLTDIEVVYEFLDTSNDMEPYPWDHTVTITATSRIEDLRFSLHQSGEAKLGEIAWYPLLPTLTVNIAGSHINITGLTSLNEAVLEATP